MLEDRTVDSSGIAKSETRRLVGSSKVEGAVIFNSRGDSVGSIYEIMIDKHSGKVAYAIMTFGGFFGIGQHYHPLPWESIEYDWRQGGYVMNAEAERQLASAPRDGLFQAGRTRH
jgi:sporulation protein YlmC with PRC-barrel domain